jgi:hypothetical protein
MNRVQTQAAYRITLLILCPLALSIAGCDAGVSEVAAVDAAAADAAATAATDVAVEATADAVTETAIGGSMDVALDLGGNTAIAEPFVPAIEAGDGADDMVAGLSATDRTDGTTITELNNRTTGELQLIAMTTRSIYHAEVVFLDTQQKRLIMQAIEKKGEAPAWGFFRLGDKAVSDLQQTKKFEFTAADGTPVTFVPREPLGTSDQ